LNEPDQRQTALIEAARQLAPALRAAYLDEACAGDAALRGRVEALLAADEPNDPYLDQPTEVFIPPSALQTSVSPETPGEAIGDMIGRYKLKEKIGEGGFGAVYVAEQREPVTRQVALKVIKLGMDTRQVVARFELERRALAMMEHPNIAKVFDAGAMDNGRPYFVMELVRGIKITDYCDEHRLSTQQRLDLFLMTCRAIQHAHQKGVIHRDIKPSNILVVSHDGVPAPKVIDFGIAKATHGDLLDTAVHTQFQQLIGTPAYMSPEQVETGGRDIDTRSDLYSLGVLLYELLTGRTPLDQKELLNVGVVQLRRLLQEKDPPSPSTRMTTMAHDELASLAAQRNADAPKLIQSLRGDLDWIVMKCLEKDRTRRYETVHDLALDIQRHLDHEPVLARPQSQYYRFQKMVRRHRVIAAAVAAVSVSLVAGVAVSASLAVRATRAQIQADKARRRAEASALETGRTLAASDFLQGARLITEDNDSDALAYLAGSLSADPANAAALARTTTLLACHSWRLSALILKHEEGLVSAQFSPDGKRIVTVCRDGTIRQWNAASGELLGEPLKVSGHLLAFSSDGKRFLTDSTQNTARVWDAQSNQLLAETPAHAGPVYSSRFSPDDARMATVAADNTGRGSARIWDARSGRPLTGPMNLGVSAQAHVEAPAWGSKSVEFSPDGNRIVSAWRISAQVWDARNGQPLTEPLLQPEQVRTARFSPDGSRIVTTSLDGTARVWDAQRGRPVTGAMQLGGGVESVQVGTTGARFTEDASAQFSPDGTRILTASWDGLTRLWDAKTGTPLTEPHRNGGPVWSARFSPDGRWILTASEDGSARLWDASGGQPLIEALKHDGPVNSAEFSPDGMRIVTASSDKTARVWNLPGASLLPEPLKFPGLVASAQLSPDFRRIVTASADGTACVWDARTGLPLTKPMQHEGPVSSARFSPDANSIVTIARDNAGRGAARVWDARTGLPLTEPLQHEGPVNSAQFSADGGRIVTASADKTARLWNVHGAHLLQTTLQHDSAVLCAQFSPDGRRILTAETNGTARLWDARNGQPLGAPMKHEGPVSWAQFSPDGRRIVTASEDMTARVWNAEDGRQLKELRHKGPVLSARFSPDSSRIVTASSDQTARVWDAWSGLPLTGLLKHDGPVYSAQFSKDADGARILTVAGDRAGKVTARLWDSQSGQPLTEPLNDIGAPRLESPQELGQFSADRRRIAVASGIWDLPPETRCPDWLPQFANVMAGQILNRQNILQPIGQNPAVFLDQLRTTLNQTTNQGDWVVWGRWFLADPFTRAISPYSSMSLPEYIENRIQENIPASIDQAQWLALGNPGLLERVSAARMLVEIENEAATLAGLNQLAEAEGKYRQLLALNRKEFATDPRKWRSSVEGLADVLVREQKSAALQQLFDDVQAPDAGSRPEPAILIYIRGCFRARTGQWREAAADFSRLIELEPGNYLNYHALAAVLLETGGPDAFRRHCANSLARFGQTDDPAAAGCIAKDCLVLLPPPELLSGAAKLADTAVATGQHHRLFSYFQLAKALSEYRQGDFRAAVQWTGQLLRQTGISPSLEAQAYMVQAMAQFETGQASQARANLRTALELAERKPSKAGSTDLGNDWIEWASGHALLNQAKELIGAR
jgi:eukaryotic-like serine/threonine-protein kinase